MVIGPRAGQGLIIFYVGNQGRSVESTDTPWLPTYKVNRIWLSLGLIRIILGKSLDGTDDHLVCYIG